MSPTVRKRTHSANGSSSGYRSTNSRGRVEHPVALEDLALVREVDRRQLEPLARDVLPDVELGPVGDREDAHLLALADAAVVEVPELGPLRARVPLAEVVAEARRSAPSRARAPRRGGRRRSPRRSRARLIASSSVVVCSRLREARGPVSSTTRPLSIDSCTEATTSRSPSSATRRSRNSITSGKLWPVSTCMSGNGKRPGRNAFSASRSSTIESLPPENSSTGRSSSAATSRMMWIASASSASRWERRTRGSWSSVPLRRGGRTRSCRCRPSGPRGRRPGAVQCVQPIEA